MVPPELLSYVRVRQRFGFPASFIRYELRRAGWHDNDIYAVLPDPRRTVGKYTRLAFNASLKSFVLVFASIGAVLVGTYFAVRLHFTDTPGIIDTQSESFWSTADIVAPVGTAPQGDSAFFNEQDYCLMNSLRDTYPAQFRRILTLALDDRTSVADATLRALATSMDSSGAHALSAVCRQQSHDTETPRTAFERLGGLIDDGSPFSWTSTVEWQFFKSAVTRDRDALTRVERETGISARMIVSQVAAEQMRLFYSNRTWFKQAISPLKVLGSMTQFSWGVVGMKPDTAKRIEDNLKNPDSPFYPGSTLEHALDFSTDSIDQERFARITSNADHYYAYLYAALFDAEIIAQWHTAGFDISARPEILATLFNIGFSHSTPNANPQIGGSTLSLDGTTISFGRFAYQFYYSDELLAEFPY